MLTPFYTHYIPLLSGSLPLNFNELMKRFVTFSQQCILSDSSLVSSVARFALAYGIMNSVFGKNVVSCSTRYNIALDYFCALDREFMLNYSICNVTCAVRDTGSSLFELLCVRDGLFELDYRALNNINEFIRLLSTA